MASYYTTVYNIVVFILVSFFRLSFVYLIHVQVQCTIPCAVSSVVSFLVVSMAVAFASRFNGLTVYRRHQDSRKDVSYCGAGTSIEDGLLSFLSAWHGHFSRALLRTAGINAVPGKHQQAQTEPQSGKPDRC